MKHYWPKLTKAEGEAYYRLADVMRKLEWEIHHKFWRGEGLPKEWHDIAIEKGPGPKEKVSLYVDRRVLKFFRATGQGWQGRVNLVLEAYALARASGAVRGVERFDLARSAERNRLDGPPPGWGQERKEEADWEDGTTLRRLTGEEPDTPWIPPDETPEERRDRETYARRVEQARLVEGMYQQGRKPDEIHGLHIPPRVDGPLD
jgi:uncharacterized protein (DUF4415 family)